MDIGPTALSLLLGILTAGVATFFHFEALTRLARLIDRHMARPRCSVVASVFGVLVAHLVEIAMFASAIAFGRGSLHLGTLDGVARGSPSTLFYVAAETFSSLGYGDIVPTGALRLLASLTSLSGILLLAWSGSFLFALAQRLHAR